MMTEAKKEKNVIRATGVGCLYQHHRNNFRLWKILINYQVPGMAEQLEKIQSELSLCEKVEAVFLQQVI